MKLKIKKIQIDELDKYNNYVASCSADKNNFRPMSINEFFSDNDNAVIADLTEIDFNNNPVAFNRGASLAGSILKGINFSSKNFILKGVDFQGADLSGAVFSDGISLDGANFGSIILTKEVFSNCKLNKAIFDPSGSNMVLFRPTKDLLKEYFSQKIDQVSGYRININKFIESKISSSFPNMNIVVDLSGMMIDQQFANCDISGSNLKKTLITGEIDGLAMRDCYTENTIFKNCKLNNCDLRGTSLAQSGKIMAQKFQAVNFEGEIELNSSALSISDIDKAIEVGLFPEISTDENLEVSAYVELPKVNMTSLRLDPCYNSQDQEKNIEYKHFTRKDVEKYLDAVKQGEKTKNFAQYFSLEENQIADFSGENLGNINFEECVFNNSNFSFCNFGGSNLSAVTMKNCNFSGANFSNRIIDSQFFRLAYVEDFISKKLGIGTKKTIMSYGNFDNSNFTWSNCNDVVATAANFNGVVGINLSAHNAIFSNVNAKNSFFNGAFLKKIEAARIQAQETCFDGAICDEANFTEGALDKVSFKEVSADKITFKEAQLNSSFFKGKFNNANFSASYINHSIIEGDISGAKFKEAEIDNIEISKITFDQDNKPAFDNYRGSPIDEIKSIDLRKSEIDRKKEANKRSTTARLAFLFLLGATIAAIGLPVSLVAIGVIPQATIQPLVTSAMYSLGIFTFDAISFAAFGKSTGASKFVANIFGANREINFENNKFEENLVDLKQKKDNLIFSSNNLAQNEKLVLDKNKFRNYSKETNSNFIDQEKKRRLDGRRLGRVN